MTDATEDTNVPAVVPVDDTVPAFLQEYKGDLGTEDIASDDVSVPRLKLAQGMSKEVKSGQMSEGDLYVNLTGEVVAAKGEDLRIVVVSSGKEFILWRDRKDGGGIFTRAHRVEVEIDGEAKVRYLWDNPNETFEHKVQGLIPVKWTTKRYIEDDGLAEWGSEIPGDKTSGIAATGHHNYVVVLPDFDNMVCALSLSRSQAKRAKDLNGMLKLSTRPAFSRYFTLTSEEESNDDQTYANYRFRPAGLIQEEEQFNFMRELFENFNEQGFKVDQSDAADQGPTPQGDDKF